MRYTRRLTLATLLAAAAALSGCSSFKLGGFCYVPAGVTGNCTVGTNVPSQAAVERFRE